MTRIQRVQIRKNDVANIRHERTKTSKNVAAIEEHLIVMLTKLVNRIRDEPYATTDISLLMRNYDATVNEVLRAAITQVWIEGINYVGDFRGVPAYISEQDFPLIQQQTQKFVNRFWQRVNAYISGRNSVLEQRLNFNMKSPLSSTYVVTSLATSLATRVLSLSTLLKSRQLLQQSRNPYVRTAAIKKIEKGLPLGLEPTYNPEQPVIQVLMVWVTAQDDQVCPICEPLDGQEFELEDSSMPVPPDDTHESCRCRLMLQEDLNPLEGTDFSEEDF
jgi:hypothetical protein